MSNPLSIVDLINGVGVDNVRVQFLDQAITNINTNKKGESNVTFGTKEITATEIAVGQSRQMALILWMPRAAVNRVHEAAIGEDRK
jgi:hypothetical protein